MNNSLEINENIPLAPLTTLKIGGRARFFARAVSESDVIEAVKFAAARGLDLLVMGGGSNILVSDSGFDGLVLRIELKGINESPAENGAVQVTAAAGEDWDRFTEYCVRKDLAGVECLGGIPGFVGAVPVQNVGAYGQDVAETIRVVRCLDRATGAIREIENPECGFAYRSSIFNTTEHGRFIVLAVRFEFTRGGEPRIVYPELREALTAAADCKKSNRQPRLVEVREAVLKIRRAKSMVIDADDPNSKSAGSFFKNPVVSEETFKALAARFDEGIPHFSVGEDSVKIPAAWLIEQAGFHKGFRLGNAGISTRHSLAIVNCGGATAAEIIALKETIELAVKEKFGIALTPEPVFVGF